MSVFNKVTLQSLKKNKTRTIVTVIGIMLSAAMICAVTTFASSFQNYILQNAIYTDGDWHGSESNTDYETYENVLISGKVENAVYTQQLGYAIAEGCKNEFKPYIYLLGASKGAENTLPIHITSGKYPTSSDEIILPDHLYENGGIKYSIGDTLALPLGSRMLDGYALTQNNPCYTYDKNGDAVLNDESIEVKEVRVYTVVGFYQRPSFEEYSAPGYTAITLADKNPSASYLYDVYFKMENPKDVYEFMEDNGFTGSRNTDVLMSSGTSQFDSFSSMIYGLAVIVIGLIMFGSISLIYNAFSISVSERTKQFGLLTSIGATKKQLRGMVFFEALAVSAIGIPLGITAGVAGIGITLKLIGNKFSALGFPIDMEICVSPLSIIIAAVIALVTVIISAWIPSKRATRISAVEAIRQTSDIKTKSKPVKTSKLTYKLFGLPGVLASKHYKRSKKKYRATVVSLFMSIVLFVSASAFTDYLMESAAGGFETNGYDLWYAGDFNAKTADEILELFKSDENIDKAAYVQETYYSGLISVDSLNDDVVENVLGGEAASMTDSDNTDTNFANVYGYINFIPDNEFRALLKQYNLDESEFMNPYNPLAIIIDGNTVFDRSNRSKGKFITVNMLNSDKCEIVCSGIREYEGYSYMEEITDEDGNTVVKYESNEDSSVTIKVPYDEAYVTYTLKSGKTVYDRPYYINQDRSSYFKVIYPISMYTKVLPDDLTRDSGFFRFYMTSDDHAASYKNLKSLLSEHGMNSNSLYDYAEQVEQNRNLVIIIQVFSYGFIVLISLIAAANVFNTISTNISLRRREFAMLKSVGMTAKGFNKMMNFECLLYGSKSLLLGLPVSCGVTYLIYLAITEGYETSFRLPWGAIGIAVLSVFLVVFATMMYSMSKIKKDNPIDALKNENL